MSHFGAAGPGFAMVMIATLTGVAHAQEPVSGPYRGDKIREEAQLTCLNCVYLDGFHALQTGHPELCEGETNCMENNCRACGGTSECHSDPREGFCHVPCQCSGDENEQSQELVLDVQAALDANDMDGLAALISRYERVDFNKERGPVQVFDCRGVMRHVALEPGVLPALSRALSQ